MLFLLFNESLEKVVKLFSGTFAKSIFGDLFNSVKTYWVFM
ncbi:hypothetical protein VPMS16_1113 [Vibrio sp. 16]|nr:hypothetical protein VPMS16_1113 [Vibrio sp. 16]